MNTAIRKVLTTGQVARRLSVSEFAIRHYTKTGRLTPVARVGPLAMRLFDWNEVEQLRMARRRRHP